MRRIQSDPQKPLTEASAACTNDGIDLAEDKVLGFVIVTQACDIARLSSQRPFVQAAPLVQVKEQDLQNIQRGRRPQYVFIPGIAEKYLVADLDRVMTLEKSVIARWHRISGCSSDAEIRAFGQALGRKQVRFAFPDDFTHLTKKLQKRLCEFLKL